MIYFSKFDAVVPYAPNFLPKKGLCSLLYALCSPLLGFVKKKKKKSYQSRKIGWNGV